MVNYKILESTSPANEQQLNEFANDGWLLQVILHFDNKLYYHFVNMVEIK